METGRTASRTRAQALADGKLANAAAYGATNRSKAAARRQAGLTKTGLRPAGARTGRRPSAAPGPYDEVL